MADILLNMSSQAAGKPAGVARFAIELARRLVAAGDHNYHFRSQWPAEQLPPELADRAALEIIPPINSFFKELLITWAQAPRRYPAARYDLILNLDALGFAVGGKRRMTIVHDIYYASVPEMYSRFARAKQRLIHEAVLGRSDIVIGISEATSAEVRRHFPRVAPRVRTVLSDSTMGAVVPGALPAPLIPQGYVLAVANATPNKNFGVLASAFARMAADRPGLKLVHVGGDTGETFETAFARHGLSDRLIRLRSIADETLAALYRDAMCLVVPSLFEGFCLPLLEAQRFGCPTIFSSRSATGEVGGTGGIAFPPEDDAALEAVLRRVAADLGLRADMIENGRANATRFSWNKTVAGYRQAISDALHGPGMPTRHPGKRRAALETG